MPFPWRHPLPLLKPLLNSPILSVAAYLIEQCQDACDELNPTVSPTTLAPTTKAPTNFPTKAPTSFPTKAPTTYTPSKAPTTSTPTKAPTFPPTQSPTRNPTPPPTTSPTPPPTHPPTKAPTFPPTQSPTRYPTPPPTRAPTPPPTNYPTRRPTPRPTPHPTRRPTPSPTPSPGLCFRPAGCSHTTCAFTCNLPYGYYPDPTDCRAYCFCTGTTAPSRYERTVVGTLWNPYCGNSQPLNSNNVPLGGMTGGCADWPYNTNTDHCTIRRRLLEDKTALQEEVALQEKNSKRRALRVLQGGTVGATCCTKCESGCGMSGDPHIKLWSGNYFDYHGECDLILLSAPDFGHGLGLQLHVRTKIQYMFSYIAVAALQIGSTVLEVASWGDYMINNVATPEGVTNLEGIFAFQHTPKDKKHHVFKVDLGNRQKIQIKTMKQWVSINFFNASAADFKNSVGLMGNFWNGAKLNRKGTAIIENELSFGQEWQVTDKDPQLFAEKRAPQFPSKCILPGERNSAVAGSRRLQEKSITEEEAKQACQHLSSGKTRELCEFDVMASGDLDMADASDF